MSESDPADVAGEIQRARRRLNFLSLVDRSCTTASVCLLAATALLLLALRGSPGWFSIGLWLSVTGAALLVLHTASTTYNAWMSAADTAREIDRRAALDDRLATLTSLESLKPADESLAAVVLAQAASMREQWAARRIAPLRPPRSVYLAAAAAALLLTASFVEREPPPPPLSAVAEKPRQPHPAQPRPQGDASKLHAAAQAAAEPGATTVSQNALSESLDPAENGGSSTDGHPAMARAPQETGMPDSPADRLPSSSLAEGDPIAGRLQELIRNALRPSQRDAHSRAALLRAEPQPRSGNGATDDARAARAQGARRDAFGGERRTGAQMSPEKAAESRLFSLRARTGGAHEPAGGAGGNGDKSTIFGKAEARSGTDRRTFPIQLSGSSRVIHMRFERPQQPPRDPLPAAGAVEAEPQKVSEVDIEDAAFHRAAIPAELEPALRRIFVTRAGP